MATKWKRTCEKACDKGWKRLVLWAALFVALMESFMGLAVATGGGVGFEAFYCFGEENYLGSRLHAREVKAAFDEVREKCTDGSHLGYYSPEEWEFQGVYELRVRGESRLNKRNIPEAAYRKFAWELSKSVLSQSQVTEYMSQEAQDKFYKEQLNLLKKAKADWYFRNELPCSYKWTGQSYECFGRAEQSGLQLLHGGRAVDEISIGFTGEMLQDGERRFRAIKEDLYAGCAIMAVGVMLALVVFLILVTDISQNRRGRRYCDAIAVCALLALCFLPGDAREMMFAYETGRGVYGTASQVAVGVEMCTVLFAAAHLKFVLAWLPGYVRGRKIATIKRDDWFFNRFFSGGKRRVTGEAYYGCGIRECSRRRTRFTLVLSAAVIFPGFYLAARSAEVWWGGVLVVVMAEAAILGAVWHWYHAGSKKIFSQYEQLLNQMNQISGGHFQTHGMLPDTSVLVGESRKMSMLGCQMQEHVEKQVQAEKMKVDLITNVSHDLKTPLTSLISYIDLLLKEDLPPAARDYAKVLEKKSGQLRKMIADVFDLAKASSGNMEVKKERVNVNRLLIQTLGDMESEIEKVKVKVVTDISETAGILKSDGDKLYRVLQNILENALKYSMPHTRVFVTLTVERREAVIQVKNVSGYEMNFTAEEVMGRFFRGDKARSTEGSGLGLAIAKEFSELCGGQFSLDISGDIFSVELCFPCHDITIPKEK